MSYILDALKKSEEERKRGSIPDPLAVQESLLRAPKKKNIWPYLIIFVLALNAVVFSLWIYAPPPKKSVTPARSSSVRVDSGDRISSPSAEKDTGGRATKGLKASDTSPTGEKVTSDNSVNISTKQQLQQQVRVDANAKIKTLESRTAAAEPGRSPAKTAIPPADAENKRASAETKSDNIPLPAPNRIYGLNELPPSLRQNLPDFVVSVFLYSEDPASRLVRVNGKMMKEGQFLDAGLKLEEIIPAGVLFSYKHYRFLIGPK